MKKIFSICLLIVLAFTLSGCGIGGVFLKIEKTNQSASDFFVTNYLNNIKNYQDISGYNFSSDLDKLTYSSYLSDIYGTIAEERCIVSALDYLMAKANDDSSNRIEPSVNEKVYEYNFVLPQELAVGTVSNSYKAYVLITATATDKKINATLFYLQDSDFNNTTSIIQNLKEKTLAQDYNLQCQLVLKTDSFDFATKNYKDIEYKKISKVEQVQDCKLNIGFNQSKGLLSYEIKTKIDGRDLTSKKLIYSYLNNEVGLRVINTKNSKSYIFEQFVKSFSKRLKIGEMISQKNIISMEAIKESEIAYASTTDASGFILEYDELKENKYSLVKYGGVDV